MTRAEPVLDGPIEGLAVRRVTRPDSSLLAELGKYESEVFGDLGLRVCDLAVVAEAGLLLVAWVGDEIVGACQSIRMMDEPESLFVVGLYVRPGWQGRRLGEALLQSAVTAAQAAGASSLLLTVAPENERALGLYKSAGFSVEESVSDLYGIGERRYLLRRCLGQGGLHGSV